MTNSISDTRTGVTDVKTFIDGMRSSRDTKMADMTALKTQLKDQNERMIKVTQDKAKLEAKNKARQAKVMLFFIILDTLGFVSESPRITLGVAKVAQKYLLELFPTSYTLHCDNQLLPLFYG